MLVHVLIISFIAALCNASIFDFVNQAFGGHGHHHQQQQQPQFNMEHEVLNSNCPKYLCKDTLACVDGPNQCPCPFPSSQLRCVLPDGAFICISKPAGDISLQYSDPNTNYMIDAQNDDVRDCGWVKRAFSGQM